MDMTLPRLYNAIGLMSGTSLDGVDVALVRTDGLTRVEPVDSAYYPYDDDLRAKIRACFGARDKTPAITDTEHALTLAHSSAVNAFLADRGMSSVDVDLIGFHGQTITHDPDHEFTWQLGDGDVLARETGIDVVYDFRTADVAAGGQGAPLIPLYHWALATSSRVYFPLAILNIGGVSNLTWMGFEEGQILAFDCGAGNALIDDYVLRRTGARFDKDGAIAKSGTPDKAILSRWLSHPFFDRTPPKSLDRDAWRVDDVDTLPFADAVATLTAFTVEAIVKATEHFPEPVDTWYVTGGGRLNGAIMDGLRERLGKPVESVDMLGWNGDALEAQGFAYLAVRSVLGLALSFPTTTGVPEPQCGGRLVRK